MTTENLEDIGKGNTLFKIDIDFYNLSDGTVKDMTDHSVFVQFRFGSPDGDVAGDFYVGSGLTWDSQATGKLEIDQIDELNWALGTYYYDVRVKESTNSELYTTTQGTMKVVKIVTKRKA